MNNKLIWSLIFALIVVSMPSTTVIKGAEEQQVLGVPVIEKNIVLYGKEKGQVNSVEKPFVKGNKITLDNVYFGKYWQGDTDGDGIAGESDEKELIKWNVVNVEGDEAVLVSDCILDWKPYNETVKYVTWETCSLRKWLNEEFFVNAFSEEEQNAICESKVALEGKNVTDKVYIDSVNEINQDLGKEETGYNKFYCREASAYAQEKGADRYPSWFYRTTGKAGINSLNIADYAGGMEENVVSSYSGIRPVIRIKLSSNLWKIAEEAEDEVVTEVDRDSLYFGKDSTGKKIKWQVLDVEGNTAFIITEGLIGQLEYAYEQFRDVRWEDSFLRDWLNNVFLEETFTQEEQKAIIETEVIDEANPYCTAVPRKTIEPGTTPKPWVDKVTNDKIYLLSLQEAEEKSYGFDHWFKKSVVRKAVNNAQDTGEWWLRTMGEYTDNAVVVSENATVCKDGKRVVETLGVRPVLHLDLTLNVWEKATEKEEEETPNPIATPTASVLPRQTEKPSVIATSDPTIMPTGAATADPTIMPTGAATADPTIMPIGAATADPAIMPTGAATADPAIMPSSTRSPDLAVRPVVSQSSRINKKKHLKKRNSQKPKLTLEKKKQGKSHYVCVQIKAKKGKKTIKLSYSKTGITCWFKIRIYQRKMGKKVDITYSQEKKIQL